MPQSEASVTAPLNTAPKWPDGFAAVFRAAGAQEKTIPCCISGDRQFFAVDPNRPRRDLGRKEIEAFLAHLTRRTGILNWQVQQARDALELYCERFSGIALSPRSEVPRLHKAPPSAIPSNSAPALPHVAATQSGDNTARLRSFRGVRQLMREGHRTG